MQSQSQRDVAIYLVKEDMYAILKDEIKINMKKKEVEEEDTEGGEGGE